MATILLVDDDPDIRELCRIYLEDLGRVLTAGDGREALALFRAQPPSAAVVDIMMPEINGYQLITEMRRSSPQLPILVLTARTQLADKVLGFQTGADDYLCKPFEPEELRLRVQALLRRASSAFLAQRRGITSGAVTLDADACRVTVEGVDMALTATQTRVLRALMEAQGRVLTLEQIYETGWQELGPVNDNSIRVFINKLRARVGERRIRTIRGIGYQWVSDEGTTR